VRHRLFVLLCCCSGDKRTKSRYAKDQQYNLSSKENP